MTEPRPLPQYGEYATPEQQAAAMGKKFVPPPAPEQLDPSPPPPIATLPVHGEKTRAGGIPADRFATVFQLGVGLAVLINSNFFQFSETYNSLVRQLGIGTKVPASLDTLGWLLLGTNIVLFLATSTWAYTRLRRGRLAFYIPAIGFVAFVVFQAVVVRISTTG